MRASHPGIKITSLLNTQLILAKFRVNGLSVPRQMMLTTACRYERPLQTGDLFASRYVLYVQHSFIIQCFSISSEAPNEERVAYHAYRIL